MENNHKKRSSYEKRLLRQVINDSESNNWSGAVLEWEITDWDEDESMESSCLCGKENLRYLFTIENQKNGNVLQPIGSKCIKKFEREELNELTSIFEKLFKLREALQNRKFIGLSSEYFSRKLLKHFYDEDVFDYDAYQFLLKMFNKRDKTRITEKQQSKINFHVINQIIPYLKENL